MIRSALVQRIVVVLVCGATVVLHREHAAGGTQAITLAADLGGESFAYVDSKTRGSRWENFFELRPRARGAWPLHAWAWEIEGRIVGDDADFTAGLYSWRNEQRRRPYLSLFAAVVDIPLSERLRVRVGKQIVNWSIMDEVQPANLLTAADESDPFRRVDVGVHSVALGYERDTRSLGLFVVPLAFTPARLPQGRWNIVPSAARRHQDLPPVRFDETQAGVRVAMRLQHLEVALMGYVGRDWAAIFVPQLTFVGGDEIFRVTIVDRYPRLRAGCTNLSYPLASGILFRSELAYLSSPDSDRDDFLHSAIGGEYAVNDWRFVVNYLRDDTLHHASEPVTDAGERRFFRSFVFGGVAYDARSRLRVRVRGGYDLTGKFLILQPQVSWRVWGDLRAGLTADLLEADAAGRSYFSRIRDEDRVSVRLDYHL